MSRLKIFRLLIFITVVLCGASFGIDAQTPAKVSDEYYKDARQTASAYVDASLRGDYYVMLQNQSQELTDEVAARGGEDYIFSEDFHKLHEMRQAYRVGCSPIETNRVAFVVDSDDAWAPKGTIVVRFYFGMQNAENKKVDLNYNDLKLDMIKIDGKWVIIRVK